MLILALSVFTRWTTRRLTVRELLECWDVPSCRWEEFETEDVVVPRTFPFLALAPSKVLLGILSSHLPAVPEQPIGQSYFSQPLQQPNLPASESPDIECIDWDMNSLRQRAAKDDDAEVLTHYWDMPFINNLLTLGRPSSFLRQVSQQVVGRSKLPVLDILRQFVLQVWRRSVFLSFQHYMLTTYGSHWFSDKSGDREAGCDCLRRVAGATFWDWACGSRILFWRWPDELKCWARDGHPVYIAKSLPQYRKRQPWEPNRDIRGQVSKKLTKFIDQGYVSQGPVRSLVSFFTVPKGESDVRVVFDGTRSGLNAALWAPSFHLLTIELLLPSLEPGYWQSDIDVGEQFYNYRLDPAIQPYCGLDVTNYIQHQPGTVLWLFWNRCVMGLTSSPHGCVKMQSLAEEVVRRNHSDPANPFFFDQVRLNLPGSSDYDPRLAKVSKIDSRTNQTAGDMSTYVDDIRTTGRTRTHCWAISHQVGTRLCYLGIQDALRKRTAPRQQSGAWTGSLAQTPTHAIIVACTVEKWNKAKGYVQDMQDTLHQGLAFNHKELEQKHGFSGLHLSYLSQPDPVS